MTNVSIILLILNILIFFNKKKLVKIYGIYDIPDNKRKIHKKKTPLTGGLIFYLNFLIFFIMTFFDQELLNTVLIIFSDKYEYTLFFFTSSIFYLIGYFDDKKDINANLKLLFITTVLITFLVLYKSLRIEIITFSFSEKNFYLGSLEFIFTLFCFLAFINAYNLFDGLNLQIGIYTLYIFLIFYFLSQNILILCFFFPLTLFLYFNSTGKIFLGNSGTYFLSFIISFLFINFFKNFENITSDQILGIMFIPGLDMLRLFVVRIFKKNNPFSADKNHLHHKLLEIYGYKKTILFIQIITVLPFFTVLILNNKFSIIYAFLIYFFILLRLNKLIKQLK